jgi:2-keto-4-pentenoate hydratase
MSPCDVSSAVDLLLEARRTGVRPAGLPAPAQPATWDDAYAIQDEITRRIGIGDPVGWKVGATTPDAEPFRAALTADTVFDGEARLPASCFNVIGVEAELVYRFNSALPPRRQAYDIAEVMAAIGSIHAAIEIVDTRYAVWDSTDRLSQIADQVNHGALIVGSGRTDWGTVDPVHQPVSLQIDGKPAFQTVGGNSAGDPLRMLVWLANTGACSLGGIKAGDRVTTGSCTGTIFVKAPCRATAEFPGVGRAVLDIA